MKTHDPHAEHEHVANDKCKPATRTHCFGYQWLKYLECSFLFICRICHQMYTHILLSI